MSEYQDQSVQSDLHNHLGFSEYSPKVGALEAATKCVQYGLSTYQISGDMMRNFPENISSDKRKQLKEYNHEHNLRFHFHAPTDIPLASRHERLRLSGVECLCEFIELAIECGAKSFIFHPGRFAYYKISSGQVIVANRNIPDIYFKRFFDSIERLVECADGRINLLLENTHDFSDKLIEIIDRFLKMKSTGLVWDIGHMQRSIIVSRRKNIDPVHIAEFFSKRLKHIKLAHIHNNNSQKGHLALDDNSLDLLSYLEIIFTLNIDMIIEVFSENDLKTSINFIESLTIKN